MNGPPTYANLVAQVCTLTDRCAELESEWEAVVGRNAQLDASLHDVESVLAGRDARVAELESENAELRARAATPGTVLSSHLVNSTDVTPRFKGTKA